MKNFVFFLLLSFLTSHLSAAWESSHEGGFHISIALSKEELSLDETTELTVAVQYPENYSLDSSALRANIAFDQTLDQSPFKIIYEEVGKVNNVDGVKFQNVIFVLEPWIEGEHLLTFMEIPFVSEQGEVFNFFSDVLKLDVGASARIAQKLAPSGPLSIEGKTSIDMEDNLSSPLSAENALKAPENDALRSVQPGRPTWYWLLALAAAIALYYVVRFLFKRKEHIGTQNLKKDYDARSEALIALERLEREQLPQLGKIEEFYIRLTAISRRYLEESYEIRAPELTTEEFLVQLSEGDLFDMEMRVVLKNFLFQADLVKFAKCRASLHECEEAIICAKNLTKV